LFVLVVFVAFIFEESGYTESMCDFCFSIGGDGWMVVVERVFQIGGVGIVDCSHLVEGRFVYVSSIFCVAVVDASILFTWNIRDEYSTCEIGIG
jgi:hypothetical protein